MCSRDKKIKGSFVLVVIFIIIGFFLLNKHTFKNSETYNIQYVKIRGQNIKVDLALTGVEQEQGLSGRTSLKNDEGMLFVFNTSGKYSFWMKDMNFAIDMIWISEDLRIVYIKKDARPESFPETFGPN